MTSITIAPTSIPTSHHKPEPNDTPNTNETDKTTSHNYSNDLPQQHINPQETFPLKNEFHKVGDIPTIRTQTPVPSFYSKKIIPNPLLNNQIQSINIPGTPTPHKKTLTTPSHVCIAYKDKTNHYLNGKVPSLSSFNTNKLAISNSNFNINTSRNDYNTNNTNNSYMKRKVHPQLDINDDKKIIKITNSLKEEVVAKQQLKLLCESEEMVRCNTMGKMEGKGNVNNGNGGIGIVGINRDKIVRLKSSSLQRCSNTNNHSGNSNNIVMINKPGTPVVGSSLSSNYQNYFFIQTNNNVNNNINNNNNNEAMLQYSHSTPPYENTIDYYNNNYSMHNINMNNTYNSFNSYNTANNDNNKTYIISNPISNSNNAHPHLTQINSPILNPNLIYNKTNRYYQYNDSLNHSNQIHSLPNLNQSCPININNSPTMTNKPITVIDSYVKKTLKHINTKETVKNQPDKKKKYINKQQSIDKHKHKDKDKPKMCLHVDIKGNSAVKSNNNKCNSNSNTQGSEKKGIKQYGSGGYYSGIVGKKKGENVFLKFHSQIYQQLTQDK